MNATGFSQEIESVLGFFYFILTSQIAFKLIQVL